MYPKDRCAKKIVHVTKLILKLQIKLSIPPIPTQGPLVPALALKDQTPSRTTTRVPMTEQGKSGIDLRAYRARGGQLAEAVDNVRLWLSVLRCHLTDTVMFWFSGTMRTKAMRTKTMRTKTMRRTLSPSCLAHCYCCYNSSNDTGSNNY